jgi:hypothetical protein
MKMANTVNGYAIFLSKQNIYHVVRCYSDKLYFYWLREENNFGREAPYFSPARLIQQLTAHLNAGIKSVEVSSAGLKENT